MKFSLIISLVLIFSFGSFSQTSRKDVFFKDCTAKQFKTDLDTASNFILIDMRSVKQYKRSRIKGAIYAQNTNVVFHLVEQYDKDLQVFIYCERGDESLTTAALLMRNGYKKIYNLREGIDDWYGEGYRLCKDKLVSSDTVDL